MFEVSLADGVRAVASHFAGVRRGYPVYRVIVDFISDKPDKGRLIKQYYIWLTDEYTEDRLRIQGRASEEDYKKVALSLAKERFDSHGEVPSEEGLEASNQRGIKRVARVQNFSHPVEKM